MSKNNALAQQEENFDLSEIADMAFDDDTVNGMMAGLIEASSHQMEVALELTRLIADKTGSATEEAILTTFKRALSTVTENFPLKPILEKMS